jgi:acylphosphatase
VRHSSPIRRRAIIHGRVQGVFFREETRRRASALGVGGWVSNLADGTVEAVFEGPDEAVGSIVRWCEDGPRGAHVRGVEVVDEPPEGLEGFQIRG